jgi:hypothetical protein
MGKKTPTLELADQQPSTSEKRGPGRPRTRPRPEELDLEKVTKRGTPRKIAPPKYGKRQPVHTTRGQLNVMKNAMLSITDPLRPPAQVRLRPQDEPFWENVIATRARDEWTPNDLILAAQLARCQSEIEDESTELESEGNIVHTTFGPKANPRAAIVEMLLKREIQLTRVLQMHALGVGKRSGKLAPLRKAEADARRIAEELQGETEDDLLASRTDDDD